MDRRRVLRLLAGAAAGVGVTGALPAAAACAGFPQVPGWRFLVLRHGDTIGEQRFTFARRSDGFVVEVAIDIVVELLGIAVYRFTHRAQEVWRDGWLRALTSTTDDDGTLWHLEFERRDGALRGRVNGAPLEVVGPVVPSSLWHPDTMTSPTLFDTIEGRLRAVSSEAMEDEAVTVAGVEVPARHFRLTGQLQREVWYDADCAIAKVTFPARDGSLITLARQ